MPVQQETTVVTPKKYSLAMRLWHWSSAALISGLLTTIFFLFVILKMRVLGPMFQEALSKDGVNLTKDQVRSLMHILGDRIWDWHIYLGVALSVALLFRVVMEFLQPGSQRFSHRLAQAREHFRHAGVDLQNARHSLLVKYCYLAFYLMLVVMVVTGLCLVYADDVEFLHKLEHTIKEVHSFNMYLIIAFAVVHIVGVVWSEVTKSRGIVSDMINGGE